MKPTRLAGLSFIAVGLAACGIVDGAVSESLPALIIFYGDTATITAPDTAQRAVSFDVRVKTFAGGCIRSTGPDNVRRLGRIAELHLYNIGQGERGITCTADLLFLSHTVTVTFDSAGPAIIRVIGARQDAATSVAPAPDTIERSIIIR